jgi:hypothetical protein
MKKLASYFIVDDGGGGGEVQYIPSDEAVRCAKAFLQDQLDAQSGVEFKLPSKDADAEEENRHRKQVERDAWDICANVVSPQTYRVWGALEEHLVRSKTSQHIFTCFLRLISPIFSRNILSFCKGGPSALKKQRHFEAKTSN